MSSKKICEKCGSSMNLSPFILTSLPPKQQWTCSCGNVIAESLLDVEEVYAYPKDKDEDVLISNVRMNDPKDLRDRDYLKNTILYLECILDALRNQLNEVNKRLE